MSKEIALEKLTEYAKNNLKDNQELCSVLFSSENILNGRIGLPVQIKYKQTARTGRVTIKKDTIYFYPPFDPFTGESTSDIKD